MSVPGRLAYIRYLHHLGVEQSRLPEPLSSASILMFHDAIEAFMFLAAEHVGAGQSVPAQLDKYWDVIAVRRTGQPGLTGRTNVAALTKVRVSVKHYGTPASRTAIDKAVADTATFMATNTQLVFGLDYDAVSMTDLIAQTEVRDMVRAGEVAQTAGNTRDAMIQLAAAFDKLFTPHRPDYSQPPVGRSKPLDFGPRISRPMSASDLAAVLRPCEQQRQRPLRGGESVAKQLDEVTQVTIQLQTAMQLAALGVDMADYQRFRMLTPYVIKTFGYTAFRAPETYAPSSEDFSFCLQFIVSMSLRKANNDQRLASPPWTTGIDLRRVKWEDIATWHRQ